MIAMMTSCMHVHTDGVLKRDTAKWLMFSILIPFTVSIIVVWSELMQ